MLIFELEASETTLSDPLTAAVVDGVKVTEYVMLPPGERVCELANPLMVKLLGVTEA
jgi:hypothetical protein